MHTRPPPAKTLSVPLLIDAARRFFTRALEGGPCPTEVTTDRAAAYPRVLGELVPAACQVTEQYAT